MSRVSVVKGSDSPMVYAITPATPFTPATQHSTSGVYRVGVTLEKKESRHVEFKAGGGNYPKDHLPDDVKRYGSAFLNGTGGVLCVGVRDDGIIQGIRLSRYSQKTEIVDTVKREFRRFTPPVGEELYQVKFVPCNRQDYYVLEISVRPGHPDQLYADGDNKMHYKRDGSVEGPLWPCKIREIVQERYIRKLEENKNVEK